MRFNNIQEFILKFLDIVIALSIIAGILIIIYMVISTLYWYGKGKKYNAKLFKRAYDVSGINELNLNFNTFMSGNKVNKVDLDEVSKGVKNVQKNKENNR